MTDRDLIQSSITVKDLFGGKNALEIYRKMVLVREFEDRVHASFQAGLIQGSTHLCQGQEAVVVGAVAALNADDYLTYTYRGHGTCLARGMSAEAAFAEIFGRKTGVSGGLGGSMHLTDMDLGLLGSFAIVGAGIPVAVGAGISAQARKEGQVAMTFFGDGATNIGAFHESMNLAAAWQLPVIFICENNLYGEYSPILTTTPLEDLVVRSDAYAMDGYMIDGNDVNTVYETVKNCVDKARDKGGPAFIECKTYRQCGHSRSDPAKYRPEGELEQWLQKDPIEMFRKKIIDEQLASAGDMDEIRDEVKDEIEKAATGAADAPWPENTDLTKYTYVIRD
ncbi:MAG: thiamine pyrophosphate-dependent dehydrogenase E1 component subunit alpha [Gammaproteobacteria bacterium]